ncbi:MFS transporter [Tsukamurella ocularis]|uniref:MFS transporter n=1 Tax=Tsukamurella ocularis TaxID=1970234 RepID=UPI002167EF26|nr:MFS transporter [Tsukamurella ocularis]MCS3779017.1 MFS family permease [Tsukamurella ocularis]MCS3787363.1 MFS family permease [Tsukamurella ocularis]MCS3851700.1 MFS family permease [Tsukamurella ocularis]
MGPFANRDFRLLFSAQVVALLGTGLTTVALGLLAYEIAGSSAAVVLGTALTIKMVLYVVIAPIAAAYVDRLPRRAFLVALDVVRAGIVLALPFVTEVWQIYVLIGTLQAASAAFTPTFQAVIPDIITDERDYTTALSASQVAYTMESLVSPVVAALALLLIDFDVLFLGTAVGFVVSAFLVLRATVPDARSAPAGGPAERILSGVRLFAGAPSLRGVFAVNFAVAAAGSIVVVNTVNYVRDRLGGSESQVAWMLAASGGGTLLVALAVPRLLDRFSERSVMLTGAALLTTSAAGAVAMAVADTPSWALTAMVWFASGSGSAMAITPTGKALRAAAAPRDVAAVFAAQFSLSHLAWLIAYPISGWGANRFGLVPAWALLAGIAAAGAVLAPALWRRTPSTLAVPVGADGDAAGAAPSAAEDRTPEREPALVAGSSAWRHAAAAGGTLTECQCTCGQAA